MLSMLMTIWFMILNELLASQALMQNGQYPQILQNRLKCEDLAGQNYLEKWGMFCRGHNYSNHRLSFFLNLDDNLINDFEVVPLRKHFLTQNGQCCSQINSKLPKRKGSYAHGRCIRKHEFIWSWVFQICPLSKPGNSR